MANWEYKIISSGKGGFASPMLMEKFLNDLGQEHWEIIHFHTVPDNPFAFNGLARRPTQRDWTLEDTAAAAARAETDKLRAEFEAKFRSATSQTADVLEEKAESFLAEERIDYGLSCLADTSRDADPDALAADEEGPKGEWDKLDEEDELPTFFDAIKPCMRRNQRGQGQSVGVDLLAKKWRLAEEDVKNALVECGLQIPVDENAKPVYAEYDGDLYWVNINHRGEIWINVREKLQPVFRVVQAKRVIEEEAAADDVAALVTKSTRVPMDPAYVGDISLIASRQPISPDPTPPVAADTLLDKIRSLMRRNQHGHSWSGSFPFLTKALKSDQTTLLTQLEELGLLLAPEGSKKPSYHKFGEFVYWISRNQRGEIWINARKNRGERNGGGEMAGSAEALPVTVERGTTKKTTRSSRRRCPSASRRDSGSDEN